jgi:hypothetical protein
MHPLSELSEVAKRVMQILKGFMAENSNLDNVK